MAEAQQSVDFVEVKPKDILAERQTGWAMFTRATVWVIGAVILLLIFLKLVFG